MGVSLVVTDVAHTRMLYLIPPRHGLGNVAKLKNLGRTVACADRCPHDPIVYAVVRESESATRSRLALNTRVFEWCTAGSTRSLASEDACNCGGQGITTGSQIPADAPT
jgi:hypothetical protein